MSIQDRDEGGARRGPPEADRAAPDRPATEVARGAAPQVRPNFPQARRHPATFMPWAWRTVLVLMSVTVLLSILAFVHGWSGPPEPPAPPEPPRAHGPAAPDALGACELRQRAERRWRAFQERLLQQRLRRTEGAVQDGLDAAFAPVYDSITPFLDWHYSVVGQYMELGQAAFGRLQEEFAARLFAGLDGRIADAAADVDRVLRDEMRESVEQWIRNEVQTLPTETLRTAYQDMLDATVPATVQRFTVSAVPSGIVAAGAGAAGAAATVTVAKGLAKKLTSSISVKAVGKTAAWIGSPWGAAAAGAAAGAVLGPAGAAVGGVLAGAAAWLAVDSAFVNVDEYFNRSALERELIGLVDESKQQAGTALSAAVDEARANALAALGSARVVACADEADADTARTLDGLRPFEVR